jgi:hypothetical protein
VDLHFLELFPGQFAGLRDDMFGYREFSNVVQQRARPQSLQLRVVQA